MFQLSLRKIRPKVAPPIRFSFETRHRKSIAEFLIGLFEKYFPTGPKTPYKKMICRPANWRSGPAFTL